MSVPRDLAIFDFDRTLVAEDSFLLFSRIAARSPMARLRTLGLASLCKSGLIGNDEYKRRILRSIWAPRSSAGRSQITEELCARLREIERSSVLRRLHEHLARRDQVVVISASPSFYLIPFVRSWSERIEVFGSSVSEDGQLIENLRGEKKAAVVRKLIRERSPAAIWVYTDSDSDLPLIELSTHVRLVHPSARLLRHLRRRGIAFEMIT